MKLMRLVFFSLVLQAILISLTEARTFDLQPEFRIPEQGKLREKVDFWIQVYSKYDSRQGLLHDSKYPTLIYEVIDFSRSKTSRFTQTKLAKERLRRILMELHGLGVDSDPSKVEKLNSEQKRIYDLFRTILEPNRFLNAAHFKRIRMQLGQKDQFMEGMRAAGRYLPFMEEVIVKKGLPFELSRLPYVESSFNTRARSKVGASGVWQFMRSTGSDFLVINDAVDERNDPIRASEAAAELLRINYDSLGNWPLAVTAYNHGRTSLMRAVRRYGTTSLEALFDTNKSRGFGFASSNFFACLLASIEIDRNSEKYFGPIDRDQPHRFVEVELPDPILLTTLVRYLRLKRPEVIAFNPAFTEEALAGRVPIPGGYRLRLPHEGTGTEAQLASQREVFLAAFQKIPMVYRGGKNGPARIKIFRKVKRSNR